jgi:hypothetical protein
MAVAWIELNPDLLLCSLIDRREAGAIDESYRAREMDLRSLGFSRFRRAAIFAAITSLTAS